MESPPTNREVQNNEEDDIRKQKADVLKKLKEKYMKGSSTSFFWFLVAKYNNKAVELEARRMNSDS